MALTEAVAAATSSNPGLAALQARAQALSSIPDQVGTWPDPSVSIDLLNLPTDTFSFTQEPMTQFHVGFMQALPFPGKLALRRLAASREADAANADVDESRQLLERDVRTVWWNLYYVDRALDVIENNRRLMEDVVLVAESRYRVGSGVQQDVLLAQLELSKLRVI